MTGSTPVLRSLAPLRLAVALAYGALLSLAAVAPTLPHVAGAPSDKLVHAVAYGGQALLLLWAFGDSLPRPRAVALAWLGATVLGLWTEVLQLFQLRRTADLGDLAADAAGAAGVMLAVIIVHVAVGLVRRAEVPG